MGDREVDIWVGRVEIDDWRWKWVTGRWKWMVEGYNGGLRDGNG